MFGDTTTTPAAAAVVGKGSCATEPAPDSVGYDVSCGACYNHLQVTLTHRHRGHAWIAAEERRQLESDGWNYLKDAYAVCPGCAPMWTAQLAGYGHMP